MFGSLGAPELMFILVLALLIFGPRKLPEIGRTVGKALSEFRKASNDLKRSINAEMLEEEVRQADPRRIVRETIAAASHPPSAERRDPDDADASVETSDSPPGSQPPSAETPAGESDPSPSGTVARGPRGSSALDAPEPVTE